MHYGAALLSPECCGGSVERNRGSLTTRIRGPTAQAANFFGKAQKATFQRRRVFWFIFEV